MNDKLNQIAMEIILHSGDGRNKIYEAMKLAISDVDFSKREEVEQLFEEAKKHINNAHEIHTEFMQSTIEDDLNVNILFSHAQDTLMTIASERNLVKHMINLKYSLQEVIREQIKK